jgi:dTDP-4-amino-4,6-dideoxygalactose transaminase
MSEQPAPVPLQDPGRDYEELRTEIDAAVADVVASGQFVLGEAVEAFEGKIADYVGVDHAVGVNSGTDALTLALEALEVGEGDEVVTSPFSFFATAEAIVHAGATPVFADIRPDTFNLDPEAVEAAIGPRTAALLPVHLYGQMADMEALGSLAERNGIPVVEDAAQAIGSWQLVGRRSPEGSGAASDTADGEGPRGSGGQVRAGAAGDLGCFSFYPTKNLGGWGDGGLVTTDNPELADRVRRLRDHGHGSGRYHYVEVGFNSRLDAMQAAVLRVKLSGLEAWNERRRENARVYDESLARVDGVTAPVVRPGNRHTYHQYTVRCRDRNGVVSALEAARVGYGVYYPRPLHLQEALSELGHAEGDYPEAERAAREVLSLPVFQGLRPAERSRVVRAVRSGAGDGRAQDPGRDPEIGRASG